MPNIKAAKEELLGLTGTKPSRAEVAQEDLFDECISEYFNKQADTPPFIYLSTLTMNIGMLAEKGRGVSEAKVKAVLDKYGR